MKKYLVWQCAIITILVSGCSILHPEEQRSRPRPESSSSTTGIRFRYAIVDDAEQFVGSPYLYAGRDPKKGFDCSGFTSYVLGRHKVTVSTASSAQSKEGKSVDLEKVLPGDLVFFGLDGSISHVAMVVSRSKDGIVCVHSTTSRGVIVENVSKSTYWKPRILFARDVIGHTK